MKLIFLSLFCLIGNVILSQVDLRNNSLIYPEKRIAFYGMYNKLEIKGINPDSSTHLIIGADTVKTYPNNDTYYYKPRRSKIDTIKLYKNGELLDTFIYRSKFLRNPKIYFGSVRDSFVTKKYLLTNPGLIVTYEPQIAKCDMSVVEFEASIIKGNGDEVDISFRWPDLTEQEIRKKEANGEVITYSSSRFTESHLDKIQDVKEGDVIWFKTVLIRSPDSVGLRKEINLRLKVIVEKY